MISIVRSKLLLGTAASTSCIHKLAVERDCAESQSQQYRWLALTSNHLRLVLRTQPRSWPTAKFTMLGYAMARKVPAEAISPSSCAHPPRVGGSGMMFRLPQL